MPRGLYLIRRCETPQCVPLNGAKYFSYTFGSIHNDFFCYLHVQAQCHVLKIQGSILGLICLCTCLSVSFSPRSLHLSFSNLHKHCKDTDKNLSHHDSWRVSKLATWYTISSEYFHVYFLQTRALLCISKTQPPKPGNWGMHHHHLTLRPHLISSYCPRKVSFSNRIDPPFLLFIWAKFWVLTWFVGFPDRCRIHLFNKWASTVCQVLF